MNLLITGGAGFIGSTLAQEAIKKKINIAIIDNLSSGKISNLPINVHFYNQDIRSCSWDSILQSIDIVFHAAAFVSAPDSFNKFDECYNINVFATWNLIRSCIKNNIKKLIFCSSSAIYPDSRLPSTELDFPNPSNPYGLSKLDVEYMLNIANKEFGLQFAALRYFNVYGPKQDKNSEYSAVIPIFINQALKNKPLIIYGTGEQSRDYVFVNDICDVILSFMNNNINGVFNVGSGKNHTLKELANLIIQKTNSKSEIIFETPRIGDVMHSIASINKIETYKLMKSRTNLIDGLERTIDFYKTNPDF